MKYTRTKNKYRINWYAVGAWAFNIVLWAILIGLVVYVLGCSTMKQSAVFTSPDGTSVKLVNSKTSIMYWSKYKARVNNHGMSADFYNAEGRPDPNSVKAIAEGVTDAFLKGVRP